MGLVEIIGISSLADGEAVKLAGWFFGDDLDLLYHRQIWPYLTPLYHPLDWSWITLNDQLDSAVQKISHPAGEAKEDR